MLSFVSLQNGKQMKPIHVETFNTSFDENEMYEEIGEWDDDYGEIIDVYVRDDIAFIAASDGPYLLIILNITNIEAPVIISTMRDLPGMAKAICLDGNYAVIGMQLAPTYSCLVDISNLSNPEIVSYFYHIFQAEDVFIEGQTVYILDYFNGTYIYDISDVRLPKLLSVYDFGNSMRAFFIEDDYMYICDEYDGLRIVDITKKNKPKLIGSDLFGGIDICVEGNYLYYMLSVQQTYIYDISIKSIPSIKNIFGYSYNQQIEVQNGFAILSDDLLGIRIYDVQNIMSIYSVGTYTQTSVANSMFILDDTIYYCEVSDGLVIIDMSTKSNPTKAGEFDLGTGGVGLKIIQKDDNTILMADYDDGLEIIDVSDPTNPYQVSEFDDNIAVMDVAVKDDCAILANLLGGVPIINLSANNEIIHWITTINSIYSVEVKDDILITRDYRHIHFYNITDIKNPILTYSYEDYFYDLYMEEDILYAIGYEGLSVINTTDITNPEFLSNYTIDASDMVLQNGFAYFSTYNNGLVVLNVTDPFNITLFSQFTGAYQYYNCISLANNITYLSTFYMCDRVLIAYNITNLTSPELAGQFIGDHWIYDIIIDNDIAYLSGEYGFSVLNLTSLVQVPFDPCPLDPPLTITPSPPPTEATNNYYLISILIILPIMAYFRKKRKVRS
jgi:hypothetical protein